MKTIQQNNIPAPSKRIPYIASFLFLSRWLQLPLYLGLVLAQCVYVFHFWVELTDLIGAVMGKKESLDHILDVVTIEGATRPDRLTETTIMLATAIIEISSIHLLKTFINAGAYDEKSLIAQTCIHLTFLVSALAIAYCDRIISQTDQYSGRH